MLIIDHLPSTLPLPNLNSDVRNSVTNFWDITSLRLMCQVTPFTLPCCRRVYVSISKLPSCPASWPNSKCPPELCIQVRGSEPEERPTGTCWRCKAQAAGKSGLEKEMLRPGIDKAYIVLGLEELGVSGRRRMVEEGGHCWFCGARGGCKECGAKEIQVTDEQPSRPSREETSRKQKHREGRPEKDRATNKRVKLEKSDDQASTPDSVYSGPPTSMANPFHPPPLPTPLAQRFSYLDPKTPSNWQPHQPYTSGSAGPSFTYDSTSCSYQAAALGNETPQNQSVVLNHPALGHWDAGHAPHDWPNMHCNTGSVLSGGQSQETIHGNIDPELLQTSTKPDSGPSPDLSSQAAWNENIQWQDNFEEIDDATLAQIMEAYNKEQANMEHKMAQKGAQQSSYIDPKLPSS